jgi:hypothetical protein
VVLWDLPAYPERFAARLATEGRSFQRTAVTVALAWYMIAER